MNCDFENCNRESGHNGPHGFEAAPGIIFAPYGGNEGKISDAAPVSLKCDSCGGEMQMRRYEEGGGTFSCQNCTQRWSFTKSSSSCTVIARLYPNAMKEDSPLYQEYLEHRLAQRSFELQASVLCGLINEQESAILMDGFQTQVDDKRRDIAARAYAKRGFWQRLIGLWERSQ